MAGEIRGSLKQVADTLISQKQILIFPHLNADGDAVGSAFALCRALRKTGKCAVVYLEEELPAYLRFLERDLSVVYPAEIPDTYASLAVDCSDSSRLGERKEAYFNGGVRICLDHHVPGSEAIAESFYIDSGSASCAELAYGLIREMEIDVDPDMAECLYTGIVTDTGNFQYSNVKASTHLIAANLYACGLDHNRAVLELFQNVKPEKQRLQILSLNEMRLFGGGRIAFSYVTRDMLRESGADLVDADGIVERMRNLSGVEIAILMKEQENGQVKATMRAKETGDVQAIAKKFGGGGHIRAAGCTMNGTPEETGRILVEEALCQLEIE